VRANEFLGRASCEILEEFQEFRASASWEEWRRVGDYVSVLVIAQNEADGNTARIGVSIGVRDVGDPGGVGEADPDGCGGLVEVRGCGELGGFG
jgi:hypothetical protein